MLKQEHHQHSKGMDAHTEDELQHVMIPACELGIERYREFRAARPNWQPKLFSQAGGHNGDGVRKMCAGCRDCLSANKFVNIKPQLMVESGGLSKGARPVAISLTKPIHHTRVPVAEIAASCQEIQNLCVSKDPQHHANKGRAAEIMAASKPPLLLPAGKVAAMAESTEQSTRLKTGEEEDVEPAGPRKTKVVELVVAPVALSEQATSSENMSDDTTTTPQMETTSLSECAAGISHGESPVGAMASSKYTADTLARAEDPILVDNQSLFEYIVASRKIPYGHSYSNLDSTMQKKLQDYYKVACPPCPHCNTSTYVKFRYFNNSGKSSLLQPRYTCRNPDTCMTMQERSGKAGSRDFTLPRPREVQMPKALPAAVNHLVQEKPLKQPQMIPHAGSKRPLQELGSPSDAGERSVKLPNTTLSLQTLNGPMPLMDMGNLQIVESLKARSVQFVKPTEDSISSSLTRTASDEQTGINVRYRTESMPENGMVVLKQPISVHTITSGNAETGTGERGSKGGKIAEVNICMYIDLSSASSC